MKHLMHAMLFLCGALLLVGCVEDDTYYSSGSGSGYVTTYQSDVTSGYNRDYQTHSDRHYYSNQTPSGDGYYRSSPPRLGYSTSGAHSPASSGYSSSQ